jgi:tetratricopeptide (TPR) repeat protein
MRPISESAGGLYWLVAESAMSGLSPGRFRVSAATDPSALSGWRIEPGEILVVPPSPEHSSLLSHLKLQRLVLQGKDDDALAEADRILLANPKDGYAWIAKGDIQMLKGNPDDALEAYDHALSLHQKSDGESIMITARRRNAFQRALEKRGVIPAQTSPP